MPWTLVHPAAVLPLRRLGARRLPFAALIFGSLSPDIGYYFSAFDLARFAHTARGLLMLSLPSGLALYVLFAALRPRLVRLLPTPHRQALLDLGALARLR